MARGGSLQQVCQQLHSIGLHELVEEAEGVASHFEEEGKNFHSERRQYMYQEITTCMATFQHTASLYLVTIQLPGFKLPQTKRYSKRLEQSLFSTYCMYELHWYAAQTPHV